MYISNVVSNYIFFEIFTVLWGIWLVREMSVVGCIYSGKYLSGICLVGEVSVGDVSGWGSVRRGSVWSGKCPSGKCLVGEVSVGDMSAWGNVRRGCVWSGKCLSGKCPSGMCPEILIYKLSTLNLFCVVAKGIEKQN